MDAAAAADLVAASAAAIANLDQQTAAFTSMFDHTGVADAGGEGSHKLHHGKGDKGAEHSSHPTHAHGNNISGFSAHHSTHIGRAGVRAGAANSGTVLSKALSTPRHIPLMQIASNMGSPMPGT
jgi:hypothetical protein